MEMQHSRSVRPTVVYDASVIKRLYVHNFRCLENFDLPISELSSALLIGSNGAGKTTVGLALEILQKIGRGANYVDLLAKPKDRFRADVPMRFEIEVDLEGKRYGYAIAFEFSAGARALRVLEESLTVDGNFVYRRNSAQVYLAKGGGAKEAEFPVRPDLVALPILQQRPAMDPVSTFNHWLARMLILRPIPSRIQGDSGQPTLWHPGPDVTDFADWFSDLLGSAPSAYAKIEEYLKQLMPDLQDIKNPVVGRDTRTLVVQFSNGQGSTYVPFEDLSDGEKCFMICAVVLAANDAHGPLLCFWDEPDSHLALSEVGHFVMALRKAFQAGGQFIATSHNPEAIRHFSDENTFVLSRRSHLEPTIVRRLTELRASGDFTGDLIDALVRGDLEP
jgi:predicted ATPase